MPALEKVDYVTYDSIVHLIPEIFRDGYCLIMFSMVAYYSSDKEETIQKYYELHKLNIRVIMCCPDKTIYYP